jgi:hypothetical protein
MAPADQAGGVPALMPLAAVGALLLFSAADLALSKRLFDARPSCWPVIGTAAAFTVWAVRARIPGLLQRRASVRRSG